MSEISQQTAEQVPIVISSHAVRVRPAGPNLFIDLHIMVDPAQ